MTPSRILLVLPLTMLVLLRVPPAIAQAANLQVVALNWEAAEYLLNLDITPMAVVDAEDYRRWVIKPALPESVPSAGSRNESNPELLAELKPDLIVTSPVLERIEPMLEHIAPVLSLEDYNANIAAMPAARQRYLSLASRVDQLPVAKERLNALTAHFEMLQCKLKAHFPAGLPDVTLARFASPTTVLVFGDNSMPDVALKQLGMKASFVLPPASWGITQLPVARLAYVNAGYVLYFEPFYQQEKLFESAMWQAMPFVRSKHFASMVPTWTYGGLFSLQYIADAIAKALLASESEQGSDISRTCADLESAQP